MICIEATELIRGIRDTFKRQLLINGLIDTALNYFIT